MTPGEYLRLRRVAAGLKVKDVAIMLAATPARYQPWFERIERIERDAEVADLIVVSELRRAFRFDSFILAQLVACLPVPAICRGCGCSWADACEDDSGPCAWSASDPCLCTHCEGREAAELARGDAERSA